MRRLFVLVAWCLGLAPAQAEPCRLALVLALDVSGSVNETEYVQQLNGLAYALNSAEVRRAILADGGAPVQLAAFEWSSQNHQFLILNWLPLATNADIDKAVSRILAYRKKRAGLKTALSTAMMFAGRLLEEKPTCWRHVIDVSGDGENNIGPSLASVYALRQFDGVTVNALAVGIPDTQDTADRNVQMLRYYEREVIRGPSAFAMIAYGYGDYERAMTQKLLRELSVPVLGSAR